MGNHWWVLSKDTIVFTPLKDQCGYDVRNGARVEPVRPTRRLLLPARELWATAVAVQMQWQVTGFKCDLVAGFANGLDVGEGGKWNQEWPPGFDLSNWRVVMLSEEWAWGGEVEGWCPNVPRHSAWLSLKYVCHIQVKRSCTYVFGSQRSEANLKIQFWES